MYSTDQKEENRVEVECPSCGEKHTITVTAKINFKEIEAEVTLDAE